MIRPVHQIVPVGDPGEYPVDILVLFGRGNKDHTEIIDEAGAIVNCGLAVEWGLKHENRE